MRLNSKVFVYNCLGWHWLLLIFCTELLTLTLILFIARKKSCICLYQRSIRFSFRIAFVLHRRLLVYSYNVGRFCIDLLLFRTEKLRGFAYYVPHFPYRVAYFRIVFLHLHKELIMFALFCTFGNYRFL